MSYLAFRFAPVWRAYLFSVTCRLWSRLLLHFWALEVERQVDCTATPDPVGFLQNAYHETVQATTSPNEWLGTTTSVTTLLHWLRAEDGKPRPVLYVTNLGDCKVLVIRPREEKVLFRSMEQWHWFDCPMQLGTNSVDTPRKNAVLSTVDLEEDDIVLALSDGVLDNLWEQEVLTITMDSVKKWAEGRNQESDRDWAPPAALAEERMVFVARELLKAALTIAQDPFAESPYMERGIEEGLAIEGGKYPIISMSAIVDDWKAKWTILASSSDHARRETANVAWVENNSPRILEIYRSGHSRFTWTGWLPAGLCLYQSFGCAGLKRLSMS